MIQDHSLPMKSQFPLFHSLGVVALTLILSTSCGDRVEHHHDAMDPRNPDYEKRLVELESELGSLSESSSYHQDDLKLSQATLQDVNDYLGRLYTNINESKVEHLPDWQQMFDALTQRDAMFDSEFKIGRPAFQTNFFHLNKSISLNSAEITELKSRMQNEEELSELHSSLLRDLEAALKSVNGSVEHINNTINEKFKLVDKVLQDYNNRVRAIEERMSAVDTRVASVESQVGSFNSRMRAAEQKLSTYDLAAMDRNLRTAQSTITNQAAMITQLQSSLALSQGELRTTQDDLRKTQQDMARSVSELRQMIIDLTKDDGE